MTPAKGRGRPLTKVIKGNESALVFGAERAHQYREFDARFLKLRGRSKLNRKSDPVDANQSPAIFSLAIDSIDGVEYLLNGSAGKFVSKHIE